MEESKPSIFSSCKGAMDWIMAGKKDDDSRPEIRFDIALCVLACAKNEKYKKRLMEFMDSYGYKHQNKAIRFKIVFLVEDEPKPDFLGDDVVWYQCPGMPLSCRLLKYIKDEPVDCRWLMQVDDDSSTDVDKTMELLEQFYSSEDCVLLMGGRNTDLEPSQQSILRIMNIDNFFFGAKDINKFDTTPYFIHAWEPSIFSGRAIERMKSWDRLGEFFSLCLKYRPTFGDQVPYVAAKMAKVPIAECLFMSPFCKSEEYSAVVPNGRLSHIHYVTDRWSGYELFKNRMLESKGRPPTPPAEQKEMWDFWSEEDGVRRHIGIMTFNDDKTIGLYSHYNEASWDRAGAKFMLINRENKPTTIMDRISDDEYAGKFLLNPRVTHRIVKIKNPKIKSRANRG